MASENFLVRNVAGFVLRNPGFYKLGVKSRKSGNPSGYFLGNSSRNAQSRLPARVSDSGGREGAEVPAAPGGATTWEAVGASRPRGLRGT